MVAPATEAVLPLGFDAWAVVVGMSVLVPVLIFIWGKDSSGLGFSRRGPRGTVRCALAAAMRSWRDVGFPHVVGTGLGVEGGEDGLFGGVADTAQNLSDCGEAFFRFGHFGRWRERAVCGVLDDLFDEHCLVKRGVAVEWLLLRQIQAGDLEAVEEQAGAARVEVVGGDALKDLADGGLDGGAVFGHGEMEGSATAALLLEMGDGLAGGVVVVAEVFSA